VVKTLCLGVFLAECFYAWFETSAVAWSHNVVYDVEKSRIIKKKQPNLPCGAQSLQEVSSRSLFQGPATF